MRKKNSKKILIIYLIVIIIPCISNLIKKLKSFTDVILTLDYIFGSLIILHIFIKTFKKRASFNHLIKWGLIGYIFALTLQIIIVWIEKQLHIFKISNNTISFIHEIKNFPLMSLIVIIAAPIMEEIVFRQILFNDFCKVYNILMSAIISSFIFALFHDDGHIITYTLIGMIFCFIYKKGKSVYADIISHVLMNATITFFYFL